MTYSRISVGAGLLAGIVLLVAALAAPPLAAQHGHPMVGTWSGFMHRGDGQQPLRVLLQMSFSVDQVISGALVVNGQRFPLASAVMDHENWTLALEARGNDRAGNAKHYSIQADIENLDSPTARTLNGSWREAGGESGDFRVVIN